MSVDTLPKPDQDNKTEDNELGWLEHNYGDPESDSDTPSTNQEEQDKVSALGGGSSGKKNQGSTKPKNEPSDTTADSKNSKWYTGGGGTEKAKNWLTKKRAAAALGLSGAIMAVTFGALVPLIGPLEFIHLAESIREPHFGAQEDFSDIRLNALYRYLRTGNIGETRLTYLQSKKFPKYTAHLAKAGFKVNYASKTGFYDGIFIDTKTKGSPYYGMTNKQIRASLAKNYDTEAFNLKGGQYYLKEGKANFRTQAKTIYQMNRESGRGVFSSAYRTRILAKYGLVTFHPLTKLDKKAGAKIATMYEAWQKKHSERIKNGARASNITTAGATQQDADGKATPAEGAGAIDGEASQSKTKSVLEGIRNSKGTSATLGVAAVAGVVCTINLINDNYSEVVYDQVYAPLIRMGTEAIAVGDQVKSGVDVDATVLDFYQRSFRGKNPGETKSTEWSQSAGIIQNNGGVGGVPMDAATAEMLADSTNDWISWVEDPSVKGVIDATCGTAGTIVVGSASFALSVISGGFFTTVGGFAASYFATEYIVDGITDLLANKSIDPSKVGAPWGGYVDYGAKYGADIGSIQSAGEIMGAGKALELQQFSKEIDDYAFSKEPLKDRLFNAKNRRSLAGKLVDKYPTSAQEGANGIATLFTGTFASLGGALGSLSPSVKAQQAPAYNYGGAPKFGWTLDEITDERFVDPYLNADKAAVILSGAKGEEYIKRAFECYGTVIADGPNGWDTTQTTDAFKTHVAGKRPTTCADRSDESWQRVRFFIWDTGLQQVDDCYDGDAAACQQIGYGSSENTQPVAPQGTSFVLADLVKDSTGVACAAGTKDLGVMDGYTEGKLVKIRVCAIPGIKSVNGSIYAGDGGDVAVNSRLSGAWLALARKAKADGVTLQSRSGFRTMAEQQKVYNRNGRDSRAGATPGYSNHQMGLAIDFHGTRIIKTSAQSCSTRVIDLGSTTWKWLNNNTAAYGIKQYSAESWHWDPDPGGIGNRCGGDGTLRT